MATVNLGSDFALGPDQTAYSFAYISPIDGEAVSMNTADTNTVIFNELRRAGEIIAKLRAELDELKAKVDSDG